MQIPAKVGGILYNHGVTQTAVGTHYPDLERTGNEFWNRISGPVSQITNYNE